MKADDKDAYPCFECGGPVAGDFEVYAHERRDGTPMIVVESTPDRDFNVCDGCNTTVHVRCSYYPQSGLCNACYAKGYDAIRV